MSHSTLLAEKEIEIVYDLAQRVLQYEKVLAEASDICGELDRFASYLIARTKANSLQSSRFDTNGQFL